MKHPRLFSTLIALVAALLVATTSVPFGLAETRSVNVNTASASELMQVNGIGQAKAAAIVAHREANGPFKSVDDLRQVRGIGEKVLEHIRPQVTVEAKADAAAPAPAAAATQE